MDSRYKNLLHQSKLRYVWLSFFVLVSTSTALVALEKTPFSTAEPKDAALDPLHEYTQWVKEHRAEEIKAVPLNASDLICPQRFDIMAKYVYGYYKKHAIESFWAFDLYAEHVRVWNNFHEGLPRKTCLADFITSFDQLLQDVANNHFKSESCNLPVMQKTVGWKALNGAHRIAAYLLYCPEKKIACHAIRKYLNSFEADWTIFKKMNPHFLDAMALTYCTLKKSTRCLILFPRAQGHDQQVRALLEDHGAIVYEKKVYLSATGIVNFMRIVYEGESWLGDWNNAFSGARGKALSCFPEGKGTCTVFLYEAEKGVCLATLKKKIRSLFNVGNHSIHSTDTHEEAVRIAQTLFVENSIHFLNNAKIAYAKNFEKLCATYKAWLEKNGYDLEHFCIDSSAVLAAYGLRDCRDLDFLAHSSAIQKVAAGIENHENQLRYYVTGKDDIIFNPTHHFYYKGLKFTSLEMVKKMKQQRHEYPKDLQDIALIESLT